MTAILDPFNHCPGLKILFPEYDYYVWEPSSFLHYKATNHMTNDKFEQVYKFRYKSDWTEIQSTKYQRLFIVFPLLDAYEGNWCTKPEAVRMWEIIQSICFHSNFKHISLFDTYDYDYDPSMLFPSAPIDIYFKRNMNKNKTYNKNIRAFPFMIFLTPCPLYILLTKQIVRPLEKRDDVFWSGGLYIHDETHQINGTQIRVLRDRETIFSEIKDYLSIQKGLAHQQFLEELSKYKFALDLQGVGDPNSRTFEIFLSGSLRLFNNHDITWPFENGDEFSPYCKFTTKEEFVENLRILHKEEEYTKALDIQERIVKKYIQKDWLRNYINRQQTS
jgi:hypothetical protein